MIITRFAPSPTGDLHIGSARTALYSYLFARHHQGQFILRIEDTDQERSNQQAVDVIFQGLNWLGLSWDHPPEYQSQRLARYHEVANQLLHDNLAYRCYLSKVDLDAMREAQIQRGEKPRYNYHSRELNLPDTGKPHVIRFKNPLSGTVTFKDEILGGITIENTELDDFILIRSDGMPTYNFAVVVDDADMGITHVIRGNDHLNNTARQLNVYRALKLIPPIFAHLPMIAGEDGKKLSKRHGAISVLQYRNEGYLAQALVNYLVRLGWSHGDQEIFSHQEMTEYFNLASVNKSPAIFDREKLNWLNQYYFKTLPWDILAPQVNWYFQYAGIETKHGPKLQNVIEIYRERAVTLADLVTKTRCYYQNTLTYDEISATTYLTPVTLPILKQLLRVLQQLIHWEAEPLKGAIHQVLHTLNLKFPMIGQPLRVALTGNTHSPSIEQVLALVGKEKTLQRLANAITWIQQTYPSAHD